VKNQDKTEICGFSLKQFYMNPDGVDNVDENRHGEQNKEAECHHCRNHEQGEFAAVKKERGNVLEVQVDFRENRLHPVNLIEYRVRSRTQHQNQPHKPQVN
jgi:hypothetical protein